MTKTILHLDMNSYFATCEQQANPYLRSKPVGIVKAAGRGCIIAASVEAKKFGVKTGCTVWDAQKLCPQIILVPSDMDKYFGLTQKLVRIARDYSPTVEVFSIDEFFLDMTEAQKLYLGGVMEVAWEMKWRVKQELGEWMKCSVGIGFSKLVAKLASEMHKPDGLTVLDESNYLAETEKVAVEEVCGIGYSITKILKSLGGYTLGQARALPAETIVARLVELGLHERWVGEILDLVWLRRAGDVAQIEDIPQAKSVSRTYTTFRVLSTQDAVLRLVRNLLEEATDKLREMEMVGRTFGLSLRGEEQEFFGRTTIHDPTDDGQIIFDLLWRKYKASPLPQVRFAGVWVSNLIANCQLPIAKQRSELLRAADKVNAKWGLYTVYPARLMDDKIIRPEVTGFLGDKYYRFKTGS